MKYILCKKILMLFTVSVFYSLIACDSMMNPIQRADNITIRKGVSTLVNEISKLDNPRGVLPTGFVPTPVDVINLGETLLYNEFFVYDENTTLIILSTTPTLYFVKIVSRDFYHRLNFEWEQLSSGDRGTDKLASSSTFYKEVGDYSIEIYFTPVEMRYGNSEGGENDYRLCVKNDQLRTDPWRLIDAAQKNVYYVPTLEDEQLFSDLQTGNHIQGHDNIIYTNSSTIATNPKLYQIVPANLGFTFIYGDELVMKDTLSPPPYPGPVYMDNEKYITRDFVLLSSLRMGNPLSSGMEYVNDNDGIIVVVRGNDLSRIKRFLEYEGISFTRTFPKAPWLQLEDTGINELKVKWYVDESVKLYYREASGAYGIPVLTSGSSYTISPLARGYEYYVRLEDSSGTFIGEESIIMPTNELLFTELMYMGTTYDGNDDFWEVKNDCNAIIDMNDVHFWSTGVDNSRATLADRGVISGATYQLLPDEYMVIGTRALGSGTIFDDVTPTHLVINTGMWLSWNYTLELRHADGRIISTVFKQEYGASYGAAKAAVRDISGEWRTSTNNSGTGGTIVYGPDTFTQTNICSPGYAADDEY